MTQQPHIDVVRAEFAKQAAKFGDARLTLANQDYLRWMVEQIAPRGDERALDVAAGTGHLTLALAPHVASIVALDGTEEMLAEGRSRAAEAGVGNVEFVPGLAESLLFPDASFDLVTSRFALHHFPDPAPALGEMVRVCRPGGRVAAVDMTSPDDDQQANRYNRLERMRDPSHTRALRLHELKALFERCGLAIRHTAVRAAPVQAERWMDLTGADEHTRRTIRAELDAEIDGGPATGMQPFRVDGELMFIHTYAVIVAERA